jgi:hypothetical protein
VVGKDLFDKKFFVDIAAVRAKRVKRGIKQKNFCAINASLAEVVRREGR